MTTSPTTDESYRATLVPELQRIQHEYGYLDHRALKEYSDNSGVPLYRLQAVASFFPHFQLTPPKKVTLHVCRDFSCHLAGSQKLLTDLTNSVVGEHVAVHGASCLGRCDRAPSACVGIVGQHDEHYYHGRSLEDLKSIVAAAVQSGPPAQDSDAANVSTLGVTKLDPYDGATPKYDAVRKVAAARDASISAAMEILRSQKGMGHDQIEQFRAGALRRLRLQPMPSADIVAAVRAWQTESDWAKGDIGGWANPFFKELDAADLRGLGGAGIPASQKWKDVRESIRSLRKRDMDDRGFIVVNGDESEPGTFKDREILLRNPHTVVEAVIVAGMLTEATQGFIYIRHEYPEQIEACRAEIRRAEALGMCGTEARELGRPFPVSVFVSPGGYICGEQSALIEAMSDRRGEPRNMPPKLETNGLMDMPTLVSNVETYAWVPFITIKGGQTYADEGVNGSKGRRLFSISGDLNRPGVYEVPMGMTLRELVEGDDYCRGIRGGKKFKAFAPSGPSGGFLPAILKGRDGLPRDHTNNKTWQALAARRGFDPAATQLELLDLELELNIFRALSPTAALGAGMAVYDETRDMVSEAVNSLEFFRNESCGKCVPCRIGSQKMASLATNLLAGNISKTRWETELIPLIEEMGSAIGLASICGLGRSVPMPMATVLKFFPEDIARHLTA